MRQVLFRLPYFDFPIFGYGLMLFFAFLLTTVLACYLGKQKGVPAQKMQDLCIAIFLFGIIGGRLTHVIAFPDQYDTLLDYVKIWKGGLVYYGGAIGGALGYFFSYWFILRNVNISSWQIADIAAPCGALGLAIGRIGCLLNGCCYGNIACVDCPAITFPMSAPPRIDMVQRGYQTAAGFTLDLLNSSKVHAVEPNSPADVAGLKPGHMIIKVNGEKVEDINHSFSNWEQGKNTVELTVRDTNKNANENITLAVFVPRTIGLHPTQIYETVSMFLIFYLLMALRSVKLRDGMIMVVFMWCYAIHRFANEMLRTDTPPLMNGLTLSQNISIAVFGAGIVLFMIIRMRPNGENPATQPVSTTPQEPVSET